MIKRHPTRSLSPHAARGLSLRDSYRLLSHLPLGCQSDLELDQISDQVFQLQNRKQISALLARIYPRRPE
jgi:hypothetical protein